MELGFCQILSLHLLRCICVSNCFSRVWLFATLWTVAPQAPLPMGFSRQEYWSALPFPPPGDLSDPRIEPASVTSPALAGRFFTTNRSLSMEMIIWFLSFFSLVWCVNWYVYIETALHLGINTTWSWCMDPINILFNWFATILLKFLHLCLLGMLTVIFWILSLYLN